MGKKEPVAVMVKSSRRIDVDSIPPYVAMNLAQAAYNAAKEAYQRPEIRADYERWKAERNARAKQEGKD